MMMMSLDECRFSVASGHSVFHQARKSKMMTSSSLDLSKVTESTTRASFVGDGRATVRFSILEEASMESDSIACSPRSAHGAQHAADRRKSHASTEEICAIQTCTNSLQFLRSKEGATHEKKRSASLSLPSSVRGENDAADRSILWTFNFGRRGGLFPRTRKMPLGEHRELEAEEGQWNFSTTKRVRSTDQVPKELRSSVMLRNIPKHYTRHDVLALLRDQDFGDINFLYLLMSTKCKTGLSNAGFAFLNFRFPEDAREFKSSFTGHVFADGKDGKGKEEAAAKVEWRYPTQGFASHFDQFVGNSVMFAKQRPEFRPMVIRDGKEVPFLEMYNTADACQKRAR